MRSRTVSNAELSEFFGPHRVPGPRKSSYLGRLRHKVLEGWFGGEPGDVQECHGSRPSQEQLWTPPLIGAAF